MKTLTRTDRSSLHIRDLYDLPGPVVSVYLGMADPAAADDLALRSRAVRHELQRSAAGGPVLDAVDEILRTAVPQGVGATAAFVGRDGARRTFDLRGADLADHAFRGWLPRLMPLLMWQQYRPPHVVVLLDRSGAEISVRNSAACGPAPRIVPGPDDEIERNAPGGWSQSRYQNRAEDSWQHNAAHSAEAAADALATADAELLIVAGDVRAEQYFRDKLPEPVRQQARIVSVSGGRSPDGSREHRREQIACAIREQVDGKIREAVTEVLDQSGPGGLGVQGVAATIHALARGRVHRLLVSQIDGATAWFGSGPTDISEHRSGISTYGGRAARHASAADVLIRAAALTDAQILVVPSEMAGELHQGVGALCRFAD